LGVLQRESIPLFISIIGIQITLREKVTAALPLTYDVSAANVAESACLLRLCLRRHDPQNAPQSKTWSAGIGTDDKQRWKKWSGNAAATAMQTESISEIAMSQGRQTKDSVATGGNN